MSATAQGSQRHDRAHVAEREDPADRPSGARTGSGQRRRGVVLLAAVVAAVVLAGCDGSTTAPPPRAATKGRADHGWLMARSGDLLRLSGCAAADFAQNGGDDCTADQIPLSAIAGACPSIGMTMVSEAVAPSGQTEVGGQEDGGFIDVLCKTGVARWPSQR